MIRKGVKIMLKNKLGITDSHELRRVEEKMTKEKAVQLYEKGIIDKLPAGTFESLRKIHEYLFSDLYDMAGKIRDVNISKGNFRFASVLYLSDAIKQVERMPQNTFDEIVKKYVEMNVVHPFREGNGRTMRLWLDAILKKELKYCIDWSKVSKEDYLLAMERSPVKDLELNALLKNALTDKINDRQIYMKGVDMSYYYEGYDVYQAESFSKQLTKKKDLGWDMEM